MIKCDNCGLCEEGDEYTRHLFIDCGMTKQLWDNAELAGTSGVHAKSYQRFAAMVVQENKKTRKMWNIILVTNFFGWVGRGSRAIGVMWEEDQRSYDGKRVSQFRLFSFCFFGIGWKMYMA